MVALERSATLQTDAAFSTNSSLNIFMIFVYLARITRIARNPSYAIIAFGCLDDTETSSNETVLIRVIRA